MIYRLAADLLLIAHATFVMFVVLGALLALRYPRLLYMHVPAVVWGVLIEFTGAICPLTPLEVRLRRLGGEAGYPGGFIDHYVVSMLYPPELTREMQIVLGFLALVPNTLAYVYLFMRRKRSS